MNKVELIGFISSIMGILSFFGMGISVFSLFKKNAYCFKFGTKDTDGFLFKKYPFVLFKGQNLLWDFKKI